MFSFNLSSSSTATIWRHQSLKPTSPSEVKPRYHSQWGENVIQVKKGENRKNNPPLNSIGIVKDLEWLTIGPTDEIFPPAGCQVLWFFTFKLFCTKCDVDGLKEIKICILKLTRRYAAYMWQFLLPWPIAEKTQNMERTAIRLETFVFSLINSASNLYKPLHTHTHSIFKHFRT